MKQYEVLYLFKPLNHHTAQKLSKISYVKFIQSSNDLDNVYIYVECNKNKTPIAKICGDFKAIGVVSEAEIQATIQKQKAQSKQFKVNDKVLFPSKWNTTPFTITNIKNQVATLEYNIKDKTIKTHAKLSLLQSASDESVDILDLVETNAKHTNQTLYIDCDSISIVDLAEFAEFIILSIIKLQFAFNAKRVILINAFLPSETILAKFGISTIIGNIYAIQEHLKAEDILVSNNHYIIKHIRLYDFNANPIPETQTLKIDTQYPKSTHIDKTNTAKSYEIKRSLDIMQLHYVAFCVDILKQKIRS